MSTRALRAPTWRGLVAVAVAGARAECHQHRLHLGLNLGGAQDCLVTRFSIENKSVHDTSLSNMANGNVYSWGRGVEINCDYHRGASYQIVTSRVDVGRVGRHTRGRARSATSH